MALAAVRSKAVVLLLFIHCCCCCSRCLSGRLALVLKTIFHQCAISYTCSLSYSDGSVFRLHWWKIVLRTWASLFVGFSVRFLFCFVVLCVLSSFAIIVMGKREKVALLLSFCMSCRCYCSLTLPRGVMGWSVVCDYGISWLYSLTF